MNGAVVESEGRLDRLLDAVVAVASDLSLPDVLRRIVESACELAGARYGALGVLDPSGDRLSDFITVGIDDRLRARIGSPPRGRGVLGELITCPRPMRLARIADHRAASGFPAHHPPMTTFLGVPVRVRGRVFGNLYLTDKHGGGEFTAEDQDVVTALSAAAGVAIENARLYDRSRRRERWLAASHAVTEALLHDGRPVDAMQLIADHAHTAANGALVAVAEPSEDGRLRVAAVAGPSAADLLGTELEPPPPGSVQRAAVPNRLPTAVTLPLTAGTDQVGVMLVGAERSDAFDDDDEAAMTTFCAHVATAARDARVQRDRRDLAIYQERDRIARELNDLVIQRLFAVGLVLQSADRLADSPAVKERIGQGITDIDQTITAVRRAVFSLRDDPAPSPGLRTELALEVQDRAATHHFEPALSFEGPLDELVAADLREELLGALREGLDNAARHAGTGHVTVEVTADPTGQRLRLVVSDDGAPRAGNGGSPVVDLAARAVRLGGGWTVHSSAEAGTTVTWTVPLGGQPVPRP